MYPPCEAASRYILPLFRSLVAKDLIEKYNLTQIEAAKKLGTTQAAISQYLHSKRGHTGVEQFKEVLPLIRDAASETAKDIVFGKKDIEKVMANFCRLCISLREARKIPA